MGSMGRVSTIERFETAFGSKIIKLYQHLIGATVVKMTSKEVSYHVKADIKLKMANKSSVVFTVHHRWTTEKEDEEGVELTDYTMEEYFNDHLKGKTIIALSVGSPDRDDETYLLAKLDNNECLEIALGFHPEFCTFSGIVALVLSEEEKSTFLND